MDWVSPQYSRSRVDSAGEILRSEPIDSQKMDEALTIINNWRSSHSRPLYTFRLGLRRHAERIDESALVAQRIKRLSSIALKLRLSRGMKLSRMHDIGGCRAVVGSTRLVAELVKRYKSSDIKHKLLREDDYIAHPKGSGYRSFHLIYGYYSDKKATHNGLRIEVQIRSQLQHAWATAVETVGTFIRQALKSSVGEDEWLRFFALMGSAIAIREGSPPVPDTPTEPIRLRDEIRRYAEKLDVANRLHTYGEALQAIESPEVVNANYYLLELDPSKMQVKILGYTNRDLNKAARD
jgi:Region found in RelA / SpoT proteins